mgnify:CR=1 FL=1
MFNLPVAFMMKRVCFFGQELNEIILRNVPLLVMKYSIISTHYYSLIGDFKDISVKIIHGHDPVE